MNVQRRRRLSSYFRDRLVNDTLPFWTGHAVDREYGGFATFLDRRGALLSPDKPMWVQARFTWLLARLYNVLERRTEWLDLARHGIEFMDCHGFDADGRVFFAVTRDGRPLRKRRYLFAEIFAILAYAEYARASGDAGALATARRTLELVRRLLAAPEGSPTLEPKVYHGTRPLRGHSMSMILVNALQVLRDADTSPDPLPYDALIDAQLDEVARLFEKPELHAVLETGGPGGEYLAELPEGRCVNPGHALETAWFVLGEARRRGDTALVERTLPIVDWSLDRGWDRRHGGILYFVDVEGKQPTPYEWDMKLWWVHNEALNATLLAHLMTGERRYERWFERILAWSLARFPDRTFGEWFGYLHRDGSVSHDLKGNLWKGPFHLPRQQLACHLMLAETLR